MRAFRFLILVALLFACFTPAEAANRFGICSTTCTWDGSSTAMWSTTTGGATGASVPSSVDTVIFDANTCVGGTTCTITVNTNVTVISITMSACTASTTGCILDFSINNNSVTLSGAAAALNSTGTATRTLKMGNGAWNISNTGSGTPWNCVTTTNFTLNAGSSTLTLAGNTASTRTFGGGGLTYNNVTFSGNTSSGAYAFSGANTFAALTFTGPQNISLTSSVTQTATSLAINGTSGSEVSIFGATNGTAATISVASGTPAMTWAAFRDMTFSGGATFTATSSFDLKGNTGVTITAPVTGSGGGRIIGG